MKPLILHPTELSQWHALVLDAQLSAHLMLNESTESYLVFLLMRYSQGAKLIESILALDFLNSLNHSRHRQIDLLRDVGDKSLLFCGLFPGMAEKRHVSLDYFVDMGQAAYLTVGELQESQSGLFYQLSEQFLMLRKILMATRSEFLQRASADDLLILPRDGLLQ